MLRWCVNDVLCSHRFYPNDVFNYLFECRVGRADSEGCSVPNGPVIITVRSQRGSASHTHQLLINGRYCTIACNGGELQPEVPHADTHAPQRVLLPHTQNSDFTLRQAQKVHQAHMTRANDGASR